MIKISLIKPILNLSNVTFDGNFDIIINFVANGGDQIYANEIEIQKNSDNTLVYTNKTVVPTFSLQQTIPANILTNGIIYKIHLRTYNNSGQFSDWSDWVIINCFSNPIIDIINVTNNGIINGQTYIFTGSYTQSENNLLQYYKYILYDSNMIELENSGLLFDGLLNYQITGFNNNSTYKIELQVTTQHNVTISIIKTFTASYIQPMFNNLVTLTNNSEQASIDIDIEAIRILGQTTGTITIENNDWVNALNGIVYFDNSNGFTLLKGDWVYEWWGSNLVDSKLLVNGVLEGTLITKLYGQNNVILKIEYYDGAFHLYKYIGDFLFSHYISNVINATADNVVYLFCKSENDRISLQCEIIS